jgi:hypothetical protein
MMGSRYGIPWENQCGTIPQGIAAVEWGATLAGVTWEQIMRGMAMDKLRSSTWPPSSTLFLAMCREIPEFNTVKLEINMPNTTRTRFGALVWSYIDPFQYRQSTVEKANHLLREAYELARTYVIDGGELPKLAEHAIEHQEEERSGKYTRSIADQKMAECMAALGIKNKPEAV